MNSEMGWGWQAAEALQTGVRFLGLPELSAHQQEQFRVYADFLVEYNQKVNLTAIRDPVEIALKHFVDSLSVAIIVELSEGKRLIDIGSGAGFPGVPLLILQPKLKVTLLDALAKRIAFLDQLLARLQLKAHLIHARAEDAAHEADLRGKFDIATARAVSNLSGLLEYSTPFLRVGGVFVAQKGRQGGEELAEAERAMNLLGLVCDKEKSLNLPLLQDNRLLLRFCKQRSTSSLYPRNPKEIREKPL